MEKAAKVQIHETLKQRWLCRNVLLRFKIAPDFSTRSLLSGLFGKNSNRFQQFWGKRKGRDWDDAFHFPNPRVVSCLDAKFSTQNHQVIIKKKENTEKPFITTTSFRKYSLRLKVYYRKI